MNLIPRLLSLFTSRAAKDARPGQTDWRKDFPPTFGAPLSPDEIEEELVFDPSTQHYARAFRRGDPKLPREEMRRWHTARRQVMEHLLSLSTTGAWSCHLVLRGSLTMRAFVGDAAREPGDLDWVVVPETIRMDQPPAHEIIDGIIKAVAKDPVCKDATIDAAEITQVDIWTYDRAPGRRLAFPWRCADLPPAVIQMDFVFEQRLRSEPHEVTIELGLLSTLSAMSASREESLAWKLLWLHSDIHPQGKDLYDAVLLAEGSTVPALLLKNVFEDADQLKHLNGARGFPFEADPAARVDWENFVKECPWVSGTASDWTTRLAHAIRPMVLELQQ